MRYLREYSSLIVRQLLCSPICCRDCPCVISYKNYVSYHFKAEKSIFVIELPPYRVPQAKTLWLSTWEKGKGFVRKAGTFIFGGSVVIWLLNYAGPSGFGVDMGDSFLAMIGGFIAPLFAPLGFGTWQAAASL